MPKKLGRSTRTISNIERGDQATALETLERLARLLEQPLAYFFEDFETDRPRGQLRRVRQEARLRVVTSSLGDVDLALALRIVEAVAERGSGQG